MRHQKDTLRRQALARRDAIPAAEQTAAARALAACAGALHLEGETVAAFWPIRSEIDPRPLMAALALRSNRLALPVLVKKDKMIFRLFEDGTKLVAMPFGLKGPPATAAMVDPAVILLPLAAFDRQGSRIGYGRGYYDRAVADMRRRGLSPRLIGLAFDCQQVEDIPAEPHDVPLQAVLTESGLKTIPFTRLCC